MAGEPKQFVIYKDNKGEWRWTLYAENNRKIADGSEGYANRVHCLHGIQLVINAVIGTAIWDHEAQQWV